MASGQIRSRLATPAAGLTLIVAAALAVRLYDLTGRSLWLDEVRTSFFATLPTPGDVVTRAEDLVNQMPLYFLAVWALHPFGIGELELRLPAAIAGTLAVAAEFLLARRLFGLRVAAVSSILMAVAPYAVWFSQEARAYALFMLLTTLQMYFAYRCVKAGPLRDWAGLAIFTILNLYTHYFALAATGAAAAYIAVFLARDMVPVLGARLSVAIGGLVAALAATAFALRRPYLGQAYAELGRLRAALHGGTLVMFAAGIAVMVIGGYWLLRRRSSARITGRVSAGLLAVLVALFLAAVAIAPAATSSGLPAWLSGALVVLAAAVAVAALRLLL